MFLDIPRFYDLMSVWYQWQILTFFFQCKKQKQNLKIIFFILNYIYFLESIYQEYRPTWGIPHSGSLFKVNCPILNTSYKFASI